LILPGFDIVAWILLAVVVVLILVIVFFVVIYIIGLRAFHHIFDRPFPRPVVDRSPQKIDQSNTYGKGRNWFYTNRMDFLDITITAYDGVKLSAYYRPAERKDSKQLVILLHGWRDHPSVMGTFAQLYLQKTDCHVLILHMRAHGMSTGRYIGYGLSDSQDLISWIQYMRKILPKPLRIVCHGWSMGAATVLLAAGSGRMPKEVKCIIADSSYSSLISQVAGMMRQKYHFAPGFLLREISRITRKHVGFGMEKISPVSKAGKIKIPVLLVHGADDSFVPPSNSDEIFQRIHSRKRLLYIEGADHVMAYDVASATYSNEIDRLLEVSGFFR
jgi:fermentation-respiration switch protein FrsA (DUF1100 family)